jgi:hypothetical protein
LSVGNDLVEDTPTFKKSKAFLARTDPGMRRWPGEIAIGMSLARRWVR